MGAPRQFENPHTLIHVGLVGRLQPLDFAQAAVLLLAPLVRHLLKERGFHETVELVDIHGVDAILKPLVFGLMAPDRILVLAAFVGVACVQGIAHPFQHLVVELEPAEQLGELCLQHLLTHIFATTRGRVALALIGVPGAMVVDVAPFLNFADHGAAAPRAFHQPRECEIVPATLCFLGEPAVKHALHAFPKFDGHEWLVPALDQLAFPFEPAGVEPVAQYGMNGAHWHLRAALGIDETCGMRLPGDLLQ